jgi:hypothetical protein
MAESIGRLRGAGGPGGITRPVLAFEEEVRAPGRSVLLAAGAGLVALRKEARGAAGGDGTGPKRGRARASGS